MDASIEIKGLLHTVFHFVPRILLYRENIYLYAIFHTGEIPAQKWKWIVFCKKPLQNKDLQGTIKNLLFFGQSMELERKLSNYLTKNLPLWSEVIHPTAGSRIGTPDLRLMIFGFQIPVELKLHHYHKSSIKISEVRPMQKLWHRQYATHGGISLFLSGFCENEKTENWELLLLPFQDIIEGKTAFHQNEVERVGIYEIKGRLEELCLENMKRNHLAVTNQ